MPGLSLELLEAVAREVPGHEPHMIDISHTHVTYNLYNYNTHIYVYIIYTVN